MVADARWTKLNVERVDVYRIHVYGIAMARRRKMKPCATTMRLALEFSVVFQKIAARHTKLTISYSCLAPSYIATSWDMPSIKDSERGINRIRFSRHISNTQAA